MAFERNDIVNKTRLAGELGEELMGFEHNDIVTVDVMEKAIAEGGGGSDFSTAEVTIVNNGSAEYEGHITCNVTTPFGEHLSGTFYVDAGNSDTYTCVMYKGQTNLDVYGWSVTLEGDAEFANDMVTITGDCTITLTDAT